MPWLTPDNDPSLVERVIFIPDGVEWEAAFLGAFLELTDAENWEQHGSLTPEETAAKWLEAYEASE
jgi:hypothetical protein